MSSDSSQPPVIVVMGDPQSFAWQQPGTASALAASALSHVQKRVQSDAQMRGPDPAPAFSSAQMSGPEQAARGPVPAAFDPHEMARDFPDRWSLYIRTNYRNLAHVMQVFAVGETTARKWWSAKGGPRGVHVAMACRHHPVAAPRILFEAAA